MISLADSDKILRDRWGRPLIAPPDGGDLVPYRRPSTVAGAISDQHNLINWSARMAALGTALTVEDESTRGRLVTPARIIGARSDRGQLQEITDELIQRSGANDARDLGTAIHLSCQLADLGQPYTKMHDAYVAEWQRSLREHDIEIYADFIEPFVVNDTYRLAGSPDRVVKYQGRNCILDIKTGGEAAPRYAQLEWAVQLAVYANAEWLMPGGRRENAVRMPPLDKARGLVFHMPSDSNPPTSVMYEIDLAVGLEALLLAFDVERLRKRTTLVAVRGVASSAAALAQEFDGQVSVDGIDQTGRVVADETERTRLRIQRLVRSGKGGDVRSLLTRLGVKSYAEAKPIHEVALRQGLLLIEQDLDLEAIDQRPQPRTAKGIAPRTDPQFEISERSQPPSEAAKRELRALESALTPEGLAVVKQWVGEAKHAGTPIGNQPQSKDWAMRVVRAGCAVRLAAMAPSTWPAYVPRVSTGSWLGLLSPIVAAELMADLAAINKEAQPSTGEAGGEAIDE